MIDGLAQNIVETMPIPPSIGTKLEPLTLENRFWGTENRLITLTTLMVVFGVRRKQISRCGRISDVAVSPVCAQYPRSRIFGLEGSLIFKHE